MMSGTSKYASKAISKIRVRSPQFKLSLDYDIANNLFKSTPKSISHISVKLRHNAFIDKCVVYIILAFHNEFRDNLHNYKVFPNIDVLLQGDNSFYSQRDCKGDFFPEKLGEQPNFSVPRDPTKKTGLGSSAALTVSFLAATFTFLQMPIYDKNRVPSK